MTKFVYVIGAVDGPQKIGVAGDPIKRLNDLQVGNPLTLMLSAQVASAEAYVLEGAAHKRLATHTIRGEWFDVSPAQAREAVEQCAAALVSVGGPYGPLDPFDYGIYPFVVEAMKLLGGKLWVSDRGLTEDEFALWQDQCWEFDTELVCGLSDRELLQKISDLLLDKVSGVPLDIAVLAIEAQHRWPELIDTKAEAHFHTVHRS